VFEWEDRREEGGADTALKTKTPHVNVGNDSTLHQKKTQLICVLKRTPTCYEIVICANFENEPGPHPVRSTWFPQMVIYDTKQSDFTG